LNEFNTTYRKRDLLKAVDNKLSLTERLEACMRDPRQPGKVVHSSFDLFRQHVYGIASGYPDCNDADALADDPIQKLLLDRDPINDQSLNSQPTLSRFENGVTSKELFVMAETLADVVIEQHADRLHVKRGAPQSIWTQPMIRPMALKNSAFSMGITTRSVICR
jgi:hypothetical protein